MLIGMSSFTNIAVQRFLQRCRVLAFVVVERKLSLLHSPGQSFLQQKMWKFSGQITSQRYSNENKTPDLETPVRQLIHRVSHVEIINAIVRPTSGYKLKFSSKELIKVPIEEIKLLHRKAGISCSKGRDIFISQCKIQLLRKLGCSVEQIQESPEILILTQTQILTQVEKLQKIGCELINPEIILIAKTEKRLSREIDLWFCGLFGFKEKREFVAAVLNCTEEDIVRFSVVNPFFKKMYGLPKFVKKVDILLRNGYTLDEIKLHQGILKFPVEKLQAKINALLKLHNGVKTPIPFLFDKKLDKTPSKPFNIWKLYVNETYHPLDECVNNYEVAANILKTDPCCLKEFKRLEKFRRKQLIKKLKILLAHKITANDIVNHIHCLNISIPRLRKAIEESQAADLQTKTINDVVNLVSNKRIPSFTKRLLCEKELANLLKVSISEIKALGLPRTWQADKIQMQENYQFLQEKGYTSDDIKQCPLLLGHKRGVLEIYFEKLAHHKELKIFRLLNHDKSRYLNALQYLIERDFDFCGVVNFKLEHKKIKMLHEEIEEMKKSTSIPCISGPDKTINENIKNNDDVEPVQDRHIQDSELL